MCFFVFYYMIANVFTSQTLPVEDKYNTNAQLFASNVVMASFYASSELRI